MLHKLRPTRLLATTVLLVKPPTLARRAGHDRPQVQEPGSPATRAVLTHLKVLYHRALITSSTSQH